jgi:hypothetical protein
VWYIGLRICKLLCYLSTLILRSGIRMAVQDDARLSPDKKADEKHPSNMHTIFLADCTPYFQWMSMGTPLRFVYIRREISGTVNLQGLQSWK